MTLLNYCTQYVSKFRKLSSGHRTEKGQFSFQSQRRAMPKNVQTTVQLCSFHMLARLCSKSFRLGSSSTWTKNFQMYKLCLGKAEEPESQLATFTGSWRKQEISISASLTILKSLSGSQQTVENSERAGNTGSHYLYPAKSVCSSTNIIYNWTWNNGLVQN